MEVHFTPDVQAKLEQMARESGRSADKLVQDAVAGFVGELAGVIQPDALAAGFVADGAGRVDQRLQEVQ